MILDKDAAAKKFTVWQWKLPNAIILKMKLYLLALRKMVFIAQKIAASLAENFKGAIKTLSLQINKKQPGEILLSENVSLKDKYIILIDDVANSGRTMLYALTPLLSQHPAEIQTLALVERTHKLFPIAVDYVGLSIASGWKEYIEVLIKDGEVQGAKLKS